MSKVLIGALLALCPFRTASLDAAVPQLISHQGRLTTAAGAPVADGLYFMKFQIYDAASGGTSLWDSQFRTVQVTGGLYTYILGQDVPFTNGLFSGGNRWLGITVGVDPEMTPRKQMIATGYAFVSQNADSVDWSGIKGVPAGFADGVDDIGDGDITAVVTAGGLTGGAASGDANISIASGGVTSAHIGDGQIVDADINAAANIAANKINGTAATLSGIQTFSGTNTFGGFFGIGDSTMKANSSGITMGTGFLPNGSNSNILEVRRHHSTSSSRIGINTSISNAGTGMLYGSYTRVSATTLGDAGAGQTTGSYILSESDHSDRYGVYSECYAKDRALTTGNSYGAYSLGFDGDQAFGAYGGATSSNYGFGVYGLANANTISYGVYGEAHNSNQITGVQGYVHNGSNGFAVSGNATGNNSAAYGIYGQATVNSGVSYGVYGRASNNTGTGYGVYGEAYLNTGSNWAGYFSGDVNVTGTIFTPVFVTRLDHPLDPENRYLQFSGVDSPEMTSVLSGNVVTDVQGNAEITVPDYFVAIAGSPRYQLTVIGDFAQAVVSRELNESGFAVRTDKPNVKVSWQITVTRQDAFANYHRVQTETVKPADEVGKFRFPEAFGQPENRGIDYPQLERARAMAAAERKKKATAAAAVAAPERDPASIE